MKHLVDLTTELLADLLEHRRLNRVQVERLRQHRHRRQILNQMLREQTSRLRNEREQLKLTVHSWFPASLPAAVAGGDVLMPWRNDISYPFHSASVILNAPSQSGVYALRNAKTWIYIGESSDILAQLVQHLNDDRMCIKTFPNLTFSYELIPAMARTWRMSELIREFRPVCQPMLG